MLKKNALLFTLIITFFMTSFMLQEGFLMKSAVAADTGKLCVIDMGSNNFKLIIGEMKDGQYTEAHIEKKKMGVGEDMTRTGSISSAKLSEIKTLLKKYAGICAEKQTGKILAVGTAAFRDAKNGGEVKAIAQSLGITMEIASEQRESELAYLVGAMGEPNQAVIDNGSRSIELAAHPADRPLQWRVSPNLGYRVAYSDYFASAKTLAEAAGPFLEKVNTFLKGAPFMKGQTRLAGVEFDDMAEFVMAPRNGHISKVSLKATFEKVAELEKLNEAEFAAFKTNTKNVDQILPRLLVTEATLRQYGYTEMEVVHYELGVGLIIEQSR